MKSSPAQSGATADWHFFPGESQEDDDQLAGTIHGQIGIERGTVVEISENSLTVENVEIVLDPTGREIEQPTRMKIPLALAMDGKGVQ